MKNIQSYEEFLNESDKKEWEKIYNEHDIKSDIYTLVKRKTKINDIITRIQKSNPDVTKSMIKNLVWDYKHEN